VADRPRALPSWLPYLDLACAAAAGALWYALPQLGPWPLWLALAPWMLRAVGNGLPSRRTPFDLPLIIFVLTAGVSVWAAYDRPAAWAKFWTIVGGVFLFYAFANAESLGSRRAWLLAFFGAGVALYFLATHSWDTYPAKIGALDRLGRALQAPLPELPGHRLHPNVAGGIMAMLMPFTGWAALQAWGAMRQPRPRRTASRWLALGGALFLLPLMAFGLLMTTSRAAWVALLAALALYALWLAVRWLARRHPAVGRWLYLAILGTALAALLAMVLLWSEGIAALLDNLPWGGTTLGRAELLRNSPALVRDYSIIGSGLGGFQMLYSTYVLLLHVGYTVHSHNLFLNVAIEQGLPALLALAATWVLFAVAVWRGVLGPIALRQSRLLGAAALSLVVLLIHGLVDDVLYGSRGVLLLFLPLAFAVPYPRAERAPVRWWAPLALPLALTLVLLLALVWRNPILSLVYSNLGAVHQSQRELSVYTWPEWPIQDEVRRTVDLSLPIGEFERALAFDPGNATANRRLGMIDLARGEWEAALGHLEAAYSAEPQSVTAQQLYGEALIVNGRLEEGRALWAGVDDSKGQLDNRVWWYGYVGDRQRAAWVRQAAGR